MTGIFWVYKMFYTSRSAIETGSIGYGCLRRRWLRYLYKGKGITQAQANIPLTTGTCVHDGIEFLMRNVANGCIPSVEQHYLAEESNWLDSACSIALLSYQKIVDDSGLEIGDQQQEFVLAQEMARTEALVRAWSIVELPQLVRYFNIYSVEDEIVVPLSEGIMFQARVDAILQERQSGRMYNYSLKTMKDYRERVNAKGKYNALNTDVRFETALQMQTEAWAAEQCLKQRFQTVSEFLKLANCRITEEKKWQQLSAFVAKYMPTTSDKIAGTKHCFLIKGGKAKEAEYGEQFAGNNPLIRGYTRIVEDTTNYCHSWYYPNPANKGGKGTIGRAWQSFNVWEKMTIKEWIALLNSKVQDHTGQLIPEIQPECGDIIKQQVITPEESFMRREEIESTIVQITQAEREVSWRTSGTFVDITFDTSLDELFPMNRSECYQMGVCEFVPICHLRDWKGDSVSKGVRDDPVGSRLYKIRVPHHRAEAEASNAYTET